jgi:hypothetical protein
MADGTPYNSRKRLGNPNGTAALRRARPKIAGIEAIKRRADEHAERLRTTVTRLRAAGVRSYSGLAAALNAEGVPTRRGGTWHHSNVRNLIARLIERDRTNKL